MSSLASCTTCVGPAWLRSVWLGTAGVRQSYATYTRQWFATPPYWASGVGAGALGGFAYACMNDDDPSNVTQRMGRGAIVGATAPVSLPVLLAYAALQPYQPPVESKRCRCGCGREYER